MNSVKLCPRCGEEKELSPQFWYRNSQTKDGFHGYCKECKSAIHKEYVKSPEVKKRIRLSIKRFQSTLGGKKMRKKYDTSEKARLRRWRSKVILPKKGEGITLEEAIIRLEHLKTLPRDQRDKIIKEDYNEKFSK